MPQRPNSAVPQSMLEGLQMILGELGGLMASADADVDFLTQLQHAVVAKIKASTQAAVDSQQQAAAQSIAPGGGAGMSGFGGIAQQAGPEMAQMAAGPSGPGGPGGMPNPDELRRVLGATGAAV